MSYPLISCDATVALVDGDLARLRTICAREIAAMAGGDRPASVIIALWLRLRSSAEVLAAAGAVSGIGDYLKLIKADPAFDAAAEFAAISAAIASAIAWIEANFPASGGYLLERRFDGNDLIERAFTPAQTADLRIQLQAITSAIQP